MAGVDIVFHYHSYVTLEVLAEIRARSQKRSLQG